MDGLLAGSLLACYKKHSQLSASIILPLRALALASLALFCVLAATQEKVVFSQTWVVGIGLPLIVIGSSYLLVECLIGRRDSLLYRLLTLRILTSFGQHSYAIYLLHLPLSLALDTLVLRWPTPPLLGSVAFTITLFFSIKFFACWLMGMASWHLFEKHFLKLKVYFPYHSEPAQRPA